MRYRTYDVRHCLLQADTTRLLHHNAPHRAGDRYAIVLFNKDLNYKGTDRPVRALDGDPRVFAERAAVRGDARRGRGG